MYLQFFQYSPGHGTEGVQNPSRDAFPICNAIPVQTEQEVPYPGTIAGFESNTDCEEQPCTCAAMDHSLWESRQWGEDCSYQMWAPQCDTTGMNMIMVLHCKVQGRKSLK